MACVGIPGTISSFCESTAKKPEEDGVTFGRWCYARSASDGEFDNSIDLKATITDFGGLRMSRGQRIFIENC
jgi:hypothetical protein